MLTYEVRDCLGDMAAQVWSQVVGEPIVKEADSKADGPGLRAEESILDPGALELMYFK